MKATWSGMISFGLVNIPVELVPATEDKDISFRLLHREDEGSIKNQRVCTHCGNVVAYKDLVRGYEYKKGEFVTVTDEDLKSAALESSKAIAIEEFVDPAEIDPLYFDKPYFITPGKNAKKPLGLLIQAMRETGKVGLARVSLRTRERLAMVRVADSKTLILQMLQYSEDVRAAEDSEVDTTPATERELKMAEMLIETMVAKFEPEKYKDQYEENLRHVIQSKLEGKEIKPVEEKREATNVVDLISQLKASIDRMEQEKSEKATQRAA